MKRNMRVLQINGFRGIFLALFIVSCLIVGFVAFPAFLTMNIWNYLAVKTGSFPPITFVEGLLLWAIIIFGTYLFNKRKFIVSFNAQQELTEDEVRHVLSKIKNQALNHNVLQSKDSKNENSSENKEEKVEISSEHKDN